MDQYKKFNIKSFGFDVFVYRNNELKLSRHAFSIKTGISAHIINHIENFQTTPQIDDAHKLATLMGKQLESYFE